jgi:hypothetical protein
MQQTLCLILCTIGQLEQSHIAFLHSLFVKPSMSRIVQNFVSFVEIVREDDISWNEITWRHCAEVTESERAVLYRCGNWPPNATQDNGNSAYLQIWQRKHRSQRVSSVQQLTSKIEHACA